MIERTRTDGTERSSPAEKDSAETVIALGKRIYRFHRRSPELVELDSESLWRVMHASSADDAEARLLAENKDTPAWTMAVRVAKLVRDVYAAGGLEEEPA